MIWLGDSFYVVFFEGGWLYQRILLIIAWWIKLWNLSCEDCFDASVLSKRVWGIRIEKSVWTNLRCISCRAILVLKNRLWFVVSRRVCSQESAQINLLWEKCSQQVFSRVIFERTDQANLVMKLVSKFGLWSMCLEPSALQHLLWQSCFETSAASNIL